MKQLFVIILLILTSAIFSAEAEAETKTEREGVLYSDGTSVHGAVRMTPGAQLRFHDGTTLRDLDPQTVREIRLVPTAEQLLRAFAMPEPGKTLRVETGEPYPQREFTALLGMRDGNELRGHLYATALLIAGEEEDVKVVLPAKQQGKPGQRLDQLVYPQRVIFTTVAPTQSSAPRVVRLVNGSADEIGLVTRDSLAPLLVAKLAPKRWSCESLLGSALYVAVVRGPQIMVGWSGDDPAIRARISQALPDIRDYYDEKHLIAVRENALPAPAAPQVDALMLLIRRGAGTDGPRNPWHVEVWRWTCDPHDPSRFLLSARGVLARGLFHKDAELPQVTADPAWWPQQVDLDTLLVGQQVGEPASAAPSDAEKNPLIKSPSGDVK